MANFNSAAAAVEQAINATPDPQVNLAVSQQLVARLGAITGVMLSAPQYRHAFLSDLEWLVMPALATGQFSIAEARDQSTGFSVPVGFVTWALVGEETDRRLSADPGYPLRLRPADWRSGAIPWLVEAIGEQRAVSAMVKTVIEQQFSETGLKAVVRGADGRPKVQVLRPGEGEPPVGGTA
jgi:cytolysin-activating lysine-acyltransferase